MNLDKLKITKTPLDRLRITLGFEGVSAAIALILLGNFVFGNLSEPRFLWPAVFMDVWTVAIFAATIRQLFMLAAIRYDEPVVELQQRVESLRLLRFRVIRFALITGLLVWWLPFLVVALKAWFGVDAYSLLGHRFLLVNALAMGIAAPLLFWLSTKFNPRIARHVEGKYISEASASLAAISEFAEVAY